MTDHEIRGTEAALLASQRLYYDLRASDYGNEEKPDRRGGPGLIDAALARALIDEFRPVGDVLELACGPGAFTGEIARHASSVTAVDASARMLEIGRTRVHDPKVRFVQADIFKWRPDRRYDAVFFGAWLSHVPPSMFDVFWDLVSRCLSPGGRVAFIDEDDRATGFDDQRSVNGMPTARRRLTDGREFDIVKVFWDPAELQSRLRLLGWSVAVRRVGETFLFGVGARI